MKTRGLTSLSAEVLTSGALISSEAEAIDEAGIISVAYDCET